MSKSLADTRTDYTSGKLERTDLDSNPYILFQNWYDEADTHVSIDANAMVLSTVDESHRPDSRVVLLKGLESERFIFYTNYESVKGQQIELNPHVSLLFFWKELQRQVRIDGLASKISEEESTYYFHSRPRESQIGAWASHQSKPLADRLSLESSYERFEAEFEGKDIPKPDYWGGYAVEAYRFEFWQGRASRLHDRFTYSQEGGEWNINRLAP